MTDIRMEQTDLTCHIYISGHNDPDICNGLSTVSFTLLNVLTEMTEAKKIEGFDAQMTDGAIDISFSVNEEYAEDWDSKKEVFAIAYAMLSEAFEGKIKCDGNIMDSYLSK